MSRTFIDKTGASMTAAAWSHQRLQSDYVTILPYTDEKMTVTAEWWGCVSDSRNMPREHWKLYRMLVNVCLRTDGEGRELPAPKWVEDKFATAYFRTANEAEAAMRAFVTETTGKVLAPKVKPAKIPPILSLEEIPPKTLSGEINSEEVAAEKKT